VKSSEKHVVDSGDGNWIIRGMNLTLRHGKTLLIDEVGKA